MCSGRGLPGNECNPPARRRQREAGVEFPSRPLYPEGMHGVTTALVAFLFVCVVFPQLIKNRPQFYAGFGLVCVIIFLDAIGMAVGGKFAVVAYFINAVVQVGAICVLFLSAGGITWRELGGELSHAFEVIRRGEDEKEIIVPLTGESPRPRDEPAPPPRVVIDDDDADDRPPPRNPGQGSSIPLD